MDRIGIFARHPVAGRVKTRLSPAIPEALVARLYAAMLADTLDATRGNAAERVLWWADEGDAAGEPDLVEHRQEGADLGERLAHAMGAMLPSPVDRAVIVGSDCPGLRPAHFEQAFVALDGADVVLGPAADGGYWLVGVRRRAALAIFRNVKWSSPGVLETTLQQAKKTGLPVRLLPTLADIDTPADLATLVAAIAGGATDACGPALLKALRETGLAR